MTSDAHLLLAFDTSTDVGSVALGTPEGSVLSRRILRRRGAHASRLLPSVRETLEDAGAGLDDVGGVVVGAGPGSFTGVRVAAATAKGLVRALGVPLRAVSSLEAGAVTGDLEVPGLAGRALPVDVAERPRHVLFDARGDRLYAGKYRVTREGVETLEPPAAARIGPLLEAESDPACVFCGSGALRHRERVEVAGFGVLPEPAGTPTADALLRIVGLEPDRPSVEDPARWEPEYLRAWSGTTGTGTGA